MRRAKAKASERGAATKPNFGSGSFAKAPGAVAPLLRLLVGTLVDAERSSREPIVVTHLGHTGAELRTGRAHDHLDVGDAIVVEIALPSDDIIAIEAYVRHVEPSRVMVVFAYLGGDVAQAIGKLLESHGG